MSSQLPDLSNPWRLVQFQKSFEGTASADSLPRLRDAVQAIVGDVTYRLDFSRGSARRAQIRGYVSGQLQMECRRCRQPVVLQLESELNLTLLESEAEAEGLPEELDVVVLADEPMRPLDLIEDELLLSLPAFPHHADDACLEPTSGAETEADETRSAGPFAVLAELKKDT